MMKNLSDRVAIIGMGCTKFGEHWDKSAEDLIVEAAYEAFEDAGIEPAQVEAGWVGTLTSGISGQALSRPLKLQYIPVTRVENMCATGQDALRNAAFAVAAGAYDVVLVAGFEKLKDSGYSGLPGAASSVIGAGNTAPGAFALAANRYFHKYGIGKEELAKISVKNHFNGARNKKSHFQKEITVEQAMKAPMIASPLGLLDCCPTTDGAAAAIITRADLAPRFTKDYVLIKAMGLAVGPGTGRMDPDFDFTSFPETKAAARQVYGQLGIKDPRKEISMAEVHDCFSITELIIYEDLGFSEPGKAKADIDAGSFTLKGDLPVNTDGGLKSFGHPIGASGLRMLYEIYNQLLGQAGERQVKDMKLGLAHNLGGNPGSFTCSIIALGHA
ncbi:MAG TPA: acetyl-CoA acetyltransferase [Blastocatellia bacterium]|nr:acetyl-CoA acetyltransferase [Blastocatellia bacterium]